MALNITLATAHRVISDFAERWPERVGRDNSPYNDPGSCMYVSNHDTKDGVKPVCIVGQFFYHFGLLGLLVTSWSVDGEKQGEHGACHIGNLRERIADFITFDDDAWDYLTVHQHMQDGRGNDLDNRGKEYHGNSMPWGEAHREALAYLRAKEEYRLDLETQRLVLTSPLFNVIGRAGTTAEDVEDALNTNPWDF